MSKGDVLDAIAAAIAELAGLRLATPIGPDNAAGLPWSARGFAVDLESERVVVRVVAAVLPLPPLLDKALVELRAALAETAWAQAALHIAVVELDAAAVAETKVGQVTPPEP
jgi:hypothetical protein